MNRALKIVLVIAAVVALLFLLGAILAKPAPDHPYYAGDLPQPLVVAHQGGDGLWPGNTLYAYERAAALGVDVLEGDVHRTQDGVLVLMHDETVDRTTDGSGLIEDMTLAELKALDAGYDWSPDDGQTFPFRGQGITVPTLEELFKTFPDLRMNIEIKLTQASMAQDLCNLIRQYNRQNLMLIASFHDARIQEFRTVCPEVATSASETEVRNLVIMNLLFLGRLYSAPAHAVQVPERQSGIEVLTPRFVNTAHHRNMKVDAWTINETVDMQRMLDLGVDGIITDYPDRLLQLLGR